MDKRTNQWSEWLLSAGRSLPPQDFTFNSDGSGDNITYELSTTTDNKTTLDKGWSWVISDGCGEQGTIAWRDIDVDKHKNKIKKLNKKIKQLEEKLEKLQNIVDVLVKKNTITNIRR